MDSSVEAASFVSAAAILDRYDSASSLASTSAASNVSIRRLNVSVCSADVPARSAVSSTVFLAARSSSSAVAMRTLADSSLALSSATAASESSARASRSRASSRAPPSTLMLSLTSEDKDSGSFSPFTGLGVLGRVFDADADSDAASASASFISASDSFDSSSSIRAVEARCASMAARASVASASHRSLSVSDSAMCRSSSVSACEIAFAAIFSAAAARFSNLAEEARASSRDTVSASHSCESLCALRVASRASFRRSASSVSSSAKPPPRA